MTSYSDQVLHHQEHHIKVPVDCPYCGLHQDVSVPEDRYLRWHRGEEPRDIRRAMPELDMNQRSLLTTGVCVDCRERRARMGRT